MTTSEFLDILSEQGLVPDGIVAQLRQKVAQGDRRLTPQSVLKYLVKKEIVSRAIAKQLLETTLIVTPSAESSILGLVPLPKVPQSPPPTIPPARVPPKEEEPLLLQAVEEEFAPLALESHAPDPGLLAAAGLDGTVDDDPLLTKSASEGSKAAKVKTAAKPKKKKTKKDRRKENEWDSPLLLLGGAGLATLLIAGTVIYYLLFRENADKTLQDAASLFDGGSYSQAITQYEKFVHDWPNHSEISQARVRLQMAKLWRDTDSKSDFTPALATAKAVTTAVQDEPAYNEGADDESTLSEAKQEMSELLTKIATGLAAQAESATNPEEVRARIDDAKTTVGLCMNTKLIPQRLRLDQELNAVRETLDRVERKLARNVDLTKTLAAMDEAIKAGDPAAAFAARKKLLADYPLLVDDQQLEAKVREVAAAEQGLVKYTAGSKPAETTERPTPIAATLALADRTAAAPGDAGEIALRIDGNLYGLNAADGGLLWRRHVGSGAPALTAPGGRTVFVDAVRREVAAVDAATGKLAWRQPLDDDLGAPAISEDMLLVPATSGKLYVLDASSGELRGMVQFTQPLREAPALSAKGDRVYVVGEHSNLYSLSTGNFSCVGVRYLGHAKGGVQAAPLVVLNKVVVAENLGVETSQLHVLGLNADGAADHVVAVRRLKGLVTTPLIAAGRRFAALTTLGEVAVFEAGSGDDDAAITQLAKRDADADDPVAAFGMLVEGQRESNLWIAADKLQKLALLPTGNRLPVRTLPQDYPGDMFDHELMRTERSLIHVRRPLNLAGAIATAMELDSNKTLWEIRLAVPAAGAAAIDAAGQRMSAVSAAGAAYLLDRQAFGRRIVDAPQRASGAPLAAALNTQVDLGAGRVAAGAVGALDLVQFRPDAPRSPVAATPLPAPLACPLVRWGDGFLAATTAGQVHYFSADDGRELAPPFQPPVTPGAEVKWRAPTPLPGDPLRFAISDGAKLYQVQLKGAGAAAELVALNELEPPQEATPDTRLAIAGTKIVAGGKQGTLVVFDGETLELAKPTPLPGRIVWGPYSTGRSDGVLARLDTGELILAGADGAVAWKLALDADPAGEPFIDGDQAWVLLGEGTLVQVDLAKGTQLGRLELGEAAVAGPTPFGPRLVVTAADGALLVVNRK